MKNLDLISKRILLISLSISSVLLSAGLLIFAARPANAQSVPQISSRMDDGRRYDAVSINSGNYAGSFLIWNTQTGTFKWIGSSGPNTSLQPSTDKNW